MRLIPALLPLLLYTLVDSAMSKNWDHHTVLDGDGVYHLHWNPPADNRGNSKIAFKVIIKAKGHFGLGLSPNGGMPGSDIVTGWIKDGKIYFQDRHAVNFSVPIIDDQQDYELIDAYENDTCTVFEFRRKLDTCDEDDMVIDKSTMRVIYAYSEEDPEGEDPFYHHEYRGSKSVMLLHRNYNDELDVNSTDVLYFDVRSPGIDISSFDTLYWCKIFQYPEISQKHHIITVKPLIQKGHEQFVHHMLWYECVGGTPEEYEVFLDQRGHDCYDPSTPPIMHTCYGVITGAGIGGEGMVLPENVGMPIYPGEEKYYLLEIHYDNPQRKSGIIDHSGLRFAYTPKVREYDAGIFAVASCVLPTVFIPPGQKEYVVVGHSSSECLLSAFPENGVKVFGNFVHMHTIGRQMKARHFRDGKELKPLVDERNYDFNFQDFRSYTEEVEILPTDQITVECIYDSRQRRNVTYNGLSTKEEMCNFFVQYYPSVDKYLSLSCPTVGNINKVLKTNIRQEMDAYGVLGTYDWKSVDIGEVENFLRYSDHVTQCHFRDTTESGRNLVSYPSDFIPYESESTCNVTM